MSVYSFPAFTNQTAPDHFPRTSNCPTRFNVSIFGYFSRLAYGEKVSLTLPLSSIWMTFLKFGIILNTYTSSIQYIKQIFNLDK